MDDGSKRERKQHDKDDRTKLGQGSGQTEHEIFVIDDGTLDTVLECADCGEQFRFTFALSEQTCGHVRHSTERGCEACYIEWTLECLAWAHSEHECTPARLGRAFKTEAPANGSTED